MASEPSAEWVALLSNTTSAALHGINGARRSVKLWTDHGPHLHRLAQRAMGRGSMRAGENAAPGWLIFGKGNQAIC
jgi:hypothetical protein